MGLRETVETVKRAKGLGKKKGYLRGINRRTHAIRRLKERYGLDMTPIQYDEACRSVENAGKKGAKPGPARFVGAKNWRFSRWLLRFKDNEVFLVWDGKLRQITTFLEPGW